LGPAAAPRGPIVTAADLAFRPGSLVDLLGVIGVAQQPAHGETGTGAGQQEAARALTGEATDTRERTLDAVALETPRHLVQAARRPLEVLSRRVAGPPTAAHGPKVIAQRPQRISRRARLAVGVLTGDIPSLVDDIAHLRPRGVGDPLGLLGRVLGRVLGLTPSVTRDLLAPRGSRRGLGGPLGGSSLAADRRLRRDSGGRRDGWGRPLAGGVN
jgi:hypothetical protein